MNMVYVGSFNLVLGVVGHVLIIVRGCVLIMGFLGTLIWEPSSNFSVFGD